MSEKPYTTYEQQLSLLKSKQLEIKDHDLAISLLKRNSYFGLISGYKRPFKGKDGLYKKHVDILDIYALYKYDMELRALFLKNILTIENHIKSLMSYAFCESYGDDQQEYLNVNNYSYTSSTMRDVNSLVSRLSELISKPGEYNYIQYQKNTYGNVPLWVLIKALTIGTVSKMYSFLQQPIKQKISKEFEYVNDTQMDGMINILSRFRNVCAHNERLFDYKYRKGSIDDTSIHRSLNLKIRNGQYIQGKSDLFAIVIVFKYLLDPSEYNIFIDELSVLICNLKRETNCITEAQLLKYMGFPSGWAQIKNISK